MNITTEQLVKIINNLEWVEEMHFDEEDFANNTLDNTIQVYKDDFINGFAQGLKQLNPKFDEQKFINSIKINV